MKKLLAMVIFLFAAALGAASCGFTNGVTGNIQCHTTADCVEQNLDGNCNPFSLRCETNCSDTNPCSQDKFCDHGRCLDALCSGHGTPMDAGGCLCERSYCGDNCEKTSGCLGSVVEDNLIVDQYNRLQWTLCPLGRQPPDCTGTPHKYTYCVEFGQNGGNSCNGGSDYGILDTTASEVYAACEGLNYAENSDWRVPSYQQLENLQHDIMMLPAGSIHGLESEGDIWSANSSGLLRAKIIRLDSSGLYSTASKDSALGVRCVREY